ncbi:protein LKAAEAR1 isoform X1 [Sapajus apella]|uniref:Protein LKAAEAR1 isoform X1 n=1 Tax=Sapajus apella TaxID=9515 RepID=A0A6J3G4D4_SAPAP|nr:protein LKAAEAR1 isoform X1 [Sapajus apella]
MAPMRGASTPPGPSGGHPRPHHPPRGFEGGAGLRVAGQPRQQAPESLRYTEVPPTQAGSKGRMPPPAKEAGRQAPQEQGGKSAPGAGRGGGGAKAAPATEPRKPGWALTPQGLAALLPAQRRRHLLFCDLLEDVGAAASTFPHGSAGPGHRMPDPRTWTQPLELPSERQNLLLGVLKAAEARGRVRALRLRYARMRAEEIALLIRQQKSARASIRLELLLPPQLRPTRIPDPLDRQEVRASPSEGGEGAPARLCTHPAPACPPAAEARGGHPGGERGQQHLPTVTATQSVQPAPTSHIKLPFSKGSLVFLLRLPRTPEGSGEYGRSLSRGSHRLI